MLTAHARSVVIVKDCPVEVDVTATREESGRRAPAGMSADVLEARSRLLRTLLEGTGAPTDGWSITSTISNVEPTTTNIKTAALAAIFKACRGGTDRDIPDADVYCGAWSWPGIHPGRCGRQARGTATAMRWAAENGYRFVSPSDTTPLSRLLPRHRRLEYAEPATPHDVRAIAAGARALTLHVPSTMAATNAATETVQRHAFRQTPEKILRAVLAPAVEAVRSGQPLLVANMADTSADWSNAAKLRLVSWLVRYLMGPMTPETEQAVIETEDLACGGPTVGYAEPLPRPSRCPHWSARRESFTPLLHQTHAHARPSELDQAVHGTLVLSMTPGRRIDRESAALVLEDWRTREDPYQIILTDERTEAERATDEPTNHPFDDVKCWLSTWPDIAEDDESGHAAAASPEEMIRNDALLDDARTTCGGALAAVSA